MQSSPARMSTTNNLVFQLRCASNNYAWGKLGSDSEVAKLLTSADESFCVNEELPYSELWMGTHPSGPSVVVTPGQPEVTLGDWIKENPARLGDRVNQDYNGALPFLFKVLSVRTSLSIQAHPNKVMAEILHKRDPGNYPDVNHKPEMAIALTDFQGLCGFRPIQEVAKFMQEIEELRVVIGHHDANKLITASHSMDQPFQREAMKSCFEALMMQDRPIVEKELEKLVNRVKAFAEAGEDTSHMVGDILLKLDSEFPGDVGGFSIYFLNVIRLHPGEALYLEANYPHAYLSGDCMECMACSDNVVRAGLTPKFIDVSTLVKMLDYTGRSVEKTKFQGRQSTENGCQVTRFSPPIWDFAVTQVQVPEDVKSCILSAMDSASIVICIEGNGLLNNRTISHPIKITRGTVLFISANEEASVDVSSNGMLLFRAHAG